jgi:hypothetical protein
MNEYQNYRGGAKATAASKRRAGSVGTSSRLLKPTHATSNKIRNSDLASEDDQESEEEVDQATSLKMEIEAIEDKIQKMGGVQSCGWDPADHKDFLRVRTKHKDRVKTVAFLTEMRRAVPTADEESIQQHIQMFQKMQDLIELKKQKMKEYKEVRSKPVQSKVDAMFGKLNADLGLDSESSTIGPKSSAAKQISAAER